MSLPRLTPDPGPILSYIARLPPEDQKIVKTEIKTALGTPSGKVLLQLIERATIDRLAPILSDPRALGALQAQSFIASDLRRILTNETEYTDASPKMDAVQSTRRGRKRG